MSFVNILLALFLPFIHMLTISKIYLRHMPYKGKLNIFFGICFDFYLNINGDGNFGLI